MNVSDFFTATPNPRYPVYSPDASGALVQTGGLVNAPVAAAWLAGLPTPAAGTYTVDQPVDWGAIIAAVQGGASRQELALGIASMIPKGPFDSPAPIWRDLNAVAAQPAAPAAAPNGSVDAAGLLVLGLLAAALARRR